jgi:hypothetical protein
LLVPGVAEPRRLAAGGDPVGLPAEGEVAESMYLLEGGSTLVLGNTGFCDLVRAGQITPSEVVANMATARDHVRTLERKDDVLAVVIRRKANFLFEHYFEDPSFAAQGPTTPAAHPSGEDAPA